ncbi:hypothetical protein B9T31_16200 [Acinetobacter sp. ANC 4558]|uniref:GtrA family protein n=1 Tax=Acinetobacter sp. ANC 4558 TaxID=1977876 RepID=UPI000A34DA29|nr:GtrA family protein [Acinetobacter sp. ANC 4558]OTG80427.1 hypothetical protein B9T31_16200 [Acinetobacter sp. ANC 4558]
MTNIFKLSMLYIVFAMIATLLNILSQQIIVMFYFGKFYIIISMLFGTIVGLFVKYFLDKKYIFKYQVNNIKHNSQLFLLYSLMGLLTTFIFWGFELSFYYIFEDKNMRYIGGIIGLIIGYMSKYFLDKKYVFRV